MSRFTTTPQKNAYIFFINYFALLWSFLAKEELIENYSTSNQTFILLI